MVFSSSSISSTTEKEGEGLNDPFMKSILVPLNHPEKSSKPILERGICLAIVRDGGHYGLWSLKREKESNVNEMCCIGQGPDPPSVRIYKDVPSIGTCGPLEDLEPYVQSSMEVYAFSLPVNLIPRAQVQGLQPFLQKIVENRAIITVHDR